MPPQTFDLDRIRRAVRQGDAEIGRGEALAMLAASPIPERARIIARVPEDHAEPVRIRVAAAVTLGRIVSAEAELELVQNLAGAESAVQIEILHSLGRIGSPEALPVTDRVAAAGSGRLAEAAQFASALIAHRSGLPGHELPRHPERMMLALPERTLEAQVTALVPEELERVVSGLTLHPYRIAFAPERFVRVDCQGQTHVVCLNEEFVGPDAVGRLLERKGLMGVVASKSPESGLTSVSHVLMTSPEERGEEVRVQVPRSSGRPALEGSARVARAVVEFRLRAIDRPGAAGAEVAGTFAAGMLTIQTAIVGRTRVPGRQPAFRVAAPQR